MLIQIIRNARLLTVLIPGLLAAGSIQAKSVIVELHSAPAARYVAEVRRAGGEVPESELQVYREQLRSEQDAFLDNLASSGIAFAVEAIDVPDLDGNVTPVDLRFTLVFNGVTLDVPDERVSSLLEFPGVKAVHKNSEHTLHLDNSIDYIRAPLVYGDVAELTPFDDFREGLEGQGVIVAIIDTGIEWSHEMFGGDLSPPRLGLEPPAAALNRNQKVIYYLPLHDAVVDDFGHGTHVAGITAGYQGFAPGPDFIPNTTDDIPVHGVAPQARLMGYKVCSGVGSASGVAGCLSAPIMLALEDAVSPRTLNGFPKPVAHVINMSLGGAGGPDSATAVAADNATLMGTIVVASAGNSGPGEGTVGSPAAGRLVIAAGANNDPGVSANPAMASFSSRGPVQGFGQVKPDVTAPGVSVLSATSPVGVPLLSMQSPTRYISASGTSFSSPHTAGMAALLKQAHPGWGVAEIRTAMINSATNLRFMDGTPRDDGLNAESILAQGGGLIDVFRAAGVKALMGVIGDGINTPEILGSHSFAEVPVIDSRVSHTVAVAVEIRDVEGNGGTYDLSIVNNRDLQLDGLSAEIAPASITVPAGGSADFNIQATINGDLLRDSRVAKVNGASVTFEPIQMQWYVQAERIDGEQTLRMPLYLKPINSLPRDGTATTEIFTGILPAADTNLGLAEGVTFIDFPIEVGDGTFQLSGDLEFLNSGIGVPDLDFFLFDPSGAEIASSANSGGPEHIEVKLGGAGIYVWRVTGFANGPTEFTVTSKQNIGPEAPVLDVIAGDFVNSRGASVDFDGAVELAWQADSTALKFEIERAIDGGAFEMIATAVGSDRSLTLADQPQGELSYRLRAFFPGQIGFFVTSPGNVETVLVDLRNQVDITGQVETAISNVSLTDGVFRFDLRMTNTSGNDFVPIVEFNVIGIDSASGTVAVINADNGGSGTSVSDPALFDYSQHLVGDDVFAAGETTGARQLQFSDERSELFTFDALVTAFDAIDGGTATGGGSGTQSDSGSEPPVNTSLLRFTVNPLTGGVSVSLLSGVIN